MPSNSFQGVIDPLCRPNYVGWTNTHPTLKDIYVKPNYNQKIVFVKVGIMTWFRCS